jgi:hypothetical protein
VEDERDRVETARERLQNAKKEDRAFLLNEEIKRLRIRSRIRPYEGEKE